MAAPRQRAAAGRSLRLLLAEDNAVNQLLAARLLEKLGHVVTVGGDGAAAIKAHATGSFDAILMNVQMPGADGFEATAEIRAQESAAGGHVPIIAMTAHAMRGVIIAARRIAWSRIRNAGVPGAVTVTKGRPVFSGSCGTGGALVDTPMSDFRAAVRRAAGEPGPSPWSPSSPSTLSSS